MLDDSTDETRSIAELAVRRLAAEGIDIKYLHRTDRTGYKAGALEAGLKVARGEFVAIFDADFLPTADFLTRLMPHFADPKVGDGAGALGPHQPGLLAPDEDPVDSARRPLRARARRPATAAGRFFNFNGTAGIWRRDRRSTTRAAGSTTR